MLFLTSFRNLDRAEVKKEGLCVTGSGEDRIENPLIYISVLECHVQKMTSIHMKRSIEVA